MTTFTSEDRIAAQLEVLPASPTAHIPVAFQCYQTPEHYVLEANIPEEIEYIKSLGFKRLVPLYDKTYRSLSLNEVNGIYEKLSNNCDKDIPFTWQFYQALEKAMTA